MIFAPDDPALQLPDSPTAQDYEAQDSGQVKGIWVQATAYYSAQDEPHVAEAVTTGMQARGYLVESLNVPTSTFGAIFGATVVAKVGLPFSDQGPPDPELATAALAASLGKFTGYTTGASDTASQVDQQVVQPTIAQAKTTFEVGGIALGTLAIVGGLLYIALLVRR